MKVVYLNSSGQLGGAENLLLDLFASLRAEAPDWSLHLIIAEKGPLSERAEKLGVKTTLVEFPASLARLGDAAASGVTGEQTSRTTLARNLLASAPGIVEYLRRLRYSLAELKPDAIHTQALKMHVLALWARPRGVPVVWHLHDYVSSRPVMARLLRMHGKRCAAAVANSQSVAGDLRSVCGTSLKIHSIYNGVNLDRFTPAGAEMNLDALAGVEAPEEGTVRVGLVATFSRWKGHRTFLEAMSLLPRELAVRGYVIGGALYQTEGSQHTQHELRSLASEFGVSDRVVFTGFIDDAASAIRSLDIVVHASTAPEPFGLVIAEAMACGRAVIASRAGGVCELIEDGANALAHSPGDARALAACIERLVRDRTLRSQLGRVGRETAEARFDYRRLASEFIPIYRTVAPEALN